MPGNYSITTRASGTILTNTIYNADHQNHVDNATPQGVGGYSANAAQMQAQTNPGGVGTESLATSIAGELERLRYTIALMSGKTYWYQAVPYVWNGGTVTGVTSFQGIVNFTTTQLNEAYHFNGSGPVANVLDISAMPGNFIDLTATGMGTINGFGSAQAGAERTIRWTGAAPCTLVNSAAILGIPGNNSITVRQYDCIKIRSLGSGSWQLVSYLPYTDPAIYGKAVKADMQAATDTQKFITPSMINNSDGAAKAWCFGAPSGGASGTSFGVTSVVRNSTGNYTITWSTAFTASTYIALAMVVGSADRTATVTAQSASSVTIQISIASSNTAEDNAYAIAAFGRQ